MQIRFQCLAALAVSYSSLRRRPLAIVNALQPHTPAAIGVQTVKSIPRPSRSHFKSEIWLIRLDNLQ